MKTPLLNRRGMRAILFAVALIPTQRGTARSDPSSLVLGSAVFDAPRQRMLVFGGSPIPPASPIYSNACWSLALDGSPRWDSLATSGVPPVPRVGHASIYDPIGDRMITFGGFDSSNSFLSDVWSLSLAGTPTWTLEHPAGVEPAPRRNCSAIYDPVRDRVLVYGGLYFNPLSGQQEALSEVWSLRLRPSLMWELVTPHGTLPPARYSHSAIYDPKSDRMLVFGGIPARNDTVWSLTLGDTTWAKLPLIGNAGHAHSAHAVIRDPIGDRMVVFGGQTDGNLLNDAWTVALSGPPVWTPLVALGTPPSARRYLTAVYDSTYRRMVLFGGEFGVTDPIWALSMGASPRWSPFPPVARASVSLLRFPPVTRGDTVSLPLTIANGGLQRLQVNELRVPSQQVRVSGVTPFQVTWNDSVTEIVSVQASELGQVQDSIVIVSNDPALPRQRILVNIDVHPFEFDTRAIGISGQAPLGEALNIVVTPHTGTRIDRGDLRYRIAGSGGAFDSLSLTPLAADFIATIPATDVTEQGLEYYVRVEHNGYSETQPVGAPAAFVTQAVAPPTQLVAIPQPNSGADFLDGRAIPIEAVLPLGANFVSGTLHYRRGGEATFVTDTLVVRSALNRPSATIAGHFVGPRGIEYWVALETSTRALRFPPTDPAVDTIRVRVQNLVEPAEHPGERYRLLSVPLDFGTDFSSGIDALLTDQFGTYNSLHWRAYAYDPETRRNLEFSDAASALALFRPSPGRAFWLVTRAAHHVDTHPIDGNSTRTGAEYPIALRSGWNMFGNPFDFPVAWSAVRHTNRVGAPVAFDPSAGLQGDYAAGAPPVLQPFEGYFIEDTAAATAPPETLWVSPTDTSAIVSSAGAAHSDAQVMGQARSERAQAGSDPRDVWRLRLRATTDLAVDGTNEFGVNVAAAEGPDPLDLPKPPLPPGPWVKVAFAHPEWGRFESYRHDLRPPGADGETWEIEVRSATPGEPVTLDLADVVAAAPGLVVRLVDRELGSTVEASRPTDSPDSPAASSVRLHYRLVSLGTRPYRLAIVAGTAAYVAHAAEQALALPTRFVLDPNAPNPFRFATRLRFGLPRATRVSAEVYSVSGQRVTSLLDRAPFVPGYHSVVWDGTTSGGGRATSGVYLVRVTMGDVALTRRLVLIR